MRAAPPCATSSKRAVTCSVNASPAVHAGIVTRTISARSSPARTSPSASSPPSSSQRASPPDASSTCDGAGVPSKESTTFPNAVAPAAGTKSCHPLDARVRGPRPPASRPRWGTNSSPSPRPTRAPAPRRCPPGSALRTSTRRSAPLRQARQGRGDRLLCDRARRPPGDASARSMAASTSDRCDAGIAGTTTRPVDASTTSTRSRPPSCCIAASARALQVVAAPVEHERRRPRPSAPRPPPPARARRRAPASRRPTTARACRSVEARSRDPSSPPASARSSW